MVKMGNVPDSARVVVNSTRGILLFIDIEHEGWGPYYSRITELCTKVVVFDLANGEGEELLEAGEYHGNSQSMFVNRDPRVPGNASECQIAPCPFPCPSPFKPRIPLQVPLPPSCSLHFQLEPRFLSVLPPCHCPLPSSDSHAAGP